MLDVIRKSFSFIEKFFCCNFFSLERMEEHRDLAKKKKKKERTMGKGAKIMVVGAINAYVSGSHLL
jgi:hypothetical protein